MGVRRQYAVEFRGDVVGWARAPIYSSPENTKTRSFWWARLKRLIACS